jgi:hypothetical protein
VEPSTSDAVIASANERERERILQQTSQRESMMANAALEGLARTALEPVD